MALHKQQKNAEVIKKKGLRFFSLIFLPIFHHLLWTWNVMKKLNAHFKPF